MRRGPPAAFCPHPPPPPQPAAHALFRLQLEEARDGAPPQQRCPQAPQGGEGRGERPAAPAAAGPGQCLEQAGSVAGGRPGGGPSDSCDGGSGCGLASGGGGPGRVAVGSQGRRGGRWVRWWSVGQQPHLTRPPLLLLIISKYSFGLCARLFYDNW